MSRVNAFRGAITHRMHLVAFHWAGFLCLPSFTTGILGVGKHPHSSLIGQGFAQNTHMHSKTHVDICFYTSILYIISTISGLIVTRHVTSFPNKCNVV